MLIRLQLHPANTGCRASHGSHFGLAKAHRFAPIREQHNILLTISNCDANQEVALIQIHCDNPARHGTRERRQGGLLHRAG